MTTDEQLLLKAAKTFIELQGRLLDAWRKANPSSNDLELLLDFPKQSIVSADDDDWKAMKHG